MSEILVVGSLAYDSIQSPEGKVDRTLGGSANYFSLAAHHFSKVRVVGVVGNDYGDDDLQMLRSRGVDTEGLQIVDGKTFHWEGKYEGDMNEAITLNTELNVFEHFNPKLPESYKNTPFAFLANIDPILQMEVLGQIQSPKLVASDTMNFWITSKKNDLLQVLQKVDLLVINETESILLTEEQNAVAAANKILQMGPKAVIIKRGEYGFVMKMGDDFFALPAYPIAKVKDPTGAGDSFAGGLFGYLASKNEPMTFENLKQACIRGAVVASFTVENFGVTPLKELTSEMLDKRMNQYLKMVTL
ncbi:MAG: sugar kinase [Bdellovibrionales bacterium]|nr:sugar kinase [Bdellovibrionales bacterium]